MLKANSNSKRYIEGNNQGGYHTARDVMPVMKDWGFGPEEVEVPVQLWHGTDDRHAPFFLGKKHADALPDSELIAVPGAGHFMAYRNFDHILERFLADTRAKCPQPATKAGCGQ